MIKISKFRIFFLICISILAISCNDGNKVIHLRDIEFIDNFPIESELAETQPTYQDWVGVQRMKGYDSIALVFPHGTKYLLQLNSLKSGKDLIKCLPIGGGPEEASYPPTFERMYIENGDAKAFLLSQNRQEAYILNLSQSAKTGEPSILKKLLTPKSKFVKNLIPLNNSDTLAIYMDLEKGEFYREIISSNGKPTKIELDFNYKFSPNENHNLLGFVPIIAMNDSVVIETGSKLNQINIYSIYNESIRKTICVGNKLDNIKSIGRKTRKNIPRAYGSGITWGNKIILLYHGLKECDYRSNKGNSEIQIFDTYFKPIARIKLPLIANSIHIDSKGILWALNYLGETESIYKFDISEFLN